VPKAFLAERYVTGRERRQQGNAGFYSAPSDCYPVKDGWIVVAVIGGPMFTRASATISAVRTNTSRSRG
jgi:crotonobetainyl-CoA:carnitine CoA-transferase CaiB-like acyl-CoA transferase